MICGQWENGMSRFNVNLNVFHVSNWENEMWSSAIQCDAKDSRCRSCAWKSPPRPHSTTKRHSIVSRFFSRKKIREKKKHQKRSGFPWLSPRFPWDSMTGFQVATWDPVASPPMSNGPQGVVPLPLEPQKGARKSWENWRFSRFLKKSQRTSGIFFLGFSHVFTFKSAVSCNTVPIKTGISSHALMMLNCNRGSLGVVTWNRISNGWGLSGRVATQKT